MVHLPPHTPVKYGFDPDKPPEVPPEAQNEGHFLPSFDERLWMFYRLWEPPQDIPVKATLLIVHGTVDHAGVYRELAREHLAPRGIAVVAMDMRGWGRSDGESMYIDSLTDTFVKDVVHMHKVVHAMPRLESVSQRFLLGKSIGGLVTAFCVRYHPDLWTGLIGLSAAYQTSPALTPSSFVLGLLSLASSVVPKMSLKPIFNDPHVIVADEGALQKWREDELCSKDRIRLGYALGLFFGCKELAKNIENQFNLPMLMMIGSQDEVVTRSGHELLLDANPNNTDKVLKVYDQGRHNLLQEPSLKEQVTKDILEWVLSHV